MVIKICFKSTAVGIRTPLKTANDGKKPQQNSNHDATECDYDPHDYGNQNHPMIFWEPVFHLLKTIVGTGILTLPYTFYTVGYLTGIVGTLLIGLLYTHIIRILLDVEYQLCRELKVPNLTYVEVVRHSLKKGPRSTRKFTSTATFLVYFDYVVNGTLRNALYLIMLGDNFKMIIDYYFNIESNIISILSIVTIFLIAIGCIRNLKFLSPLSAVTNGFNLIIFLLIFSIPPYYCASCDINAFNDFTQFPVFFGIVLRAFTGTGIILPLKNDMKEPAEFASPFGVLHVVLTSTTALYAIFGFLGYLKFGNLVQANILTNLPTDHYSSILILVLYSMGICVSYTLSVYIAFDTIWSNSFQSGIPNVKYPLAKEYATRIGLVILPYFVAMAVPNFEIMIMIGGVIGILIDIAIPPILHVLLMWERTPKRKFTNLIILKDFIIIVMAFSLFVGGVNNVFHEITRFYTQ